MSVCLPEVPRGLECYCGESLGNCRSSFGVRSFLSFSLMTMAVEGMRVGMLLAAARYRTADQLHPTLPS